MGRRRLVLSTGAIALAAAGAQLIRIGGEARSVPPVRNHAVLDLSSYADAPPGAGLRLLFLHHSVGGQLLAEPGPEHATGASIYEHHPNGGGLRKRLQDAGYEVVEASYGSELGEDTDLFDWLPKLRDRMDRVLAGGTRIVVLKSCYPNSRIVGRGTEPGSPAGPELTLANARATLSALLPEMARHPEALFVYLTAPPVAPNGYAEPLWKWLAKAALGRRHTADAVAAQAALARELNDWVVSPVGWLSGYEGRNVVAFDYFDLLTDEGASNLSRYASGDRDDSHPSQTGQRKAAAAFVPFLNRAVARAGLAAVAP